MQTWAVFTGDIVNSSALDAGALGAVFDALAHTAKVIEGWGGGPVAFARFRGDGWQMALPPHFVLRAALVTRAGVRATGKGHDTRIGIGLGDGALNGSDPGAAEGPAFVRSGTALDGLKRKLRMAAPDGPAALRSALPLADRIVQGWTPKQAQVAAALLVPEAPTHDVVGAHLGRSRQMTQKQAESAGIDALVEACLVLEAP